VIRPFLGIIL